MTNRYLLGQPWPSLYYLTFSHPLLILEYWQKQVNPKFNGGGCAILQAPMQLNALAMIVVPPDSDALQYIRALSKPDMLLVESYLSLSEGPIVKAGCICSDECLPSSTGTQAYERFHNGWRQKLEHNQKGPFHQY